MLGRGADIMTIDDSFGSMAAAQSSGAARQRVALVQGLDLQSP